MSSISRQSMRAAALRFNFTQHGADQAAESSISRARDVRLIWADDALKHLAKARDALILADAPQALAKVRRAIKSAEGARRHARLDFVRACRHERELMKGTS
jgi:hypothetical protein